MQIKTRAAAVGGALCAVGVATSLAAPAADARSTVPPPYSITNANTCEQMRNAPNMRTLRYKLRTASGSSSAPELRVRIGWAWNNTASAPSVCAYVADYVSGRHHMNLVLARDGWQTRASDAGYFENYAGALHVKGPGASGSWNYSIYARVNYGGRDYVKRVSGKSTPRNLSYTSPDAITRG